MSVTSYKNIEWAKAVIELDAEPDNIGTAAKIILREVAKLEAENKALRAGWQPIETAPDEGVFLVYMPTDARNPIQVAKWHPKVKVIGNLFAFDAHPPTHWMPLPPPPATEETKR